MTMSSTTEQIGERVLRDVQNGVEGLHQFIDNFAGVEILDESERDILDRILFTAKGFCCRSGDRPAPGQGGE